MDQAHETSIHLDATPDRVWEALTDPDGAATWLGDGTVLEPVEGGRIDTPDPESGVPRTGRVNEAVPGARLSYTWWPTDPDSPVPASRVTIDLIPSGASTRLVVTELPLPDRRLAPHSARACTTASAGHIWTWRLASVEVGIWCRTAIAIGVRP